MNAFFTLIIVVQVLSALVVIGLVLLQHGKGADMGAAFGSGASGSLFGATGSSNFLSKSTGVAAAIFFASTLGLALIGNPDSGKGVGVMENLSAQPVVPSNSAPPQAASTQKATQAPASKESGQANQIPK